MNLEEETAIFRQGRPRVHWASTVHRCNNGLVSSAPGTAAVGALMACCVVVLAVNDPAAGRKAGWGGARPPPRRPRTATQRVPRTGRLGPPGLRHCLESDIMSHGAPQRAPGSGGKGRGSAPPKVLCVVGLCSARGPRPSSTLHMPSGIAVRLRWSGGRGASPTGRAVAFFDTPCLAPAAAAPCAWVRRSLPIASEALHFDSQALPRPQQSPAELNFARARHRPAGWQPTPSAGCQRSAE